MAMTYRNQMRKLIDFMEKLFGDYKNKYCILSSLINRTYSLATKLNETI